jgi:uncharacterized membrane protein YfcA
LDSLLFTIVCLLIGAIAGVLGGLLGIGGGVIVVPALIFLFDHTGMLADHAGPGNGTTLVAVGTSLATIIFTSAAAAVTQTRARMVDWAIVRRFTPMVMLASYGSGFVAALLPLATLRASIGFFLGFVSIVMLTNWRPSPHRLLPGAGASAAIAGIAGLVSGIAGIGGGNVVVPTLVYYNVPVHRATATASVLGFPIAIAGSLGYVTRGLGITRISDGLLGYVYVPALLTIGLVSVLLAPAGVRMAHALQPLPLRRAFGAVLVLVSLRMLWTAFVPQT